MKRNSLLIFLLLSTLFAKKFVAVLEMDPIGLTDQEGRILTQRLTSEIINADVYSVVERTNLEKILKEQKFQHSGCTDSECAVEIGQLVNANYIVIGTASKFGSTYTIDVRMIDVAMGHAISTAVFNHKGELDDLVTDGIVTVARELCGLNVAFHNKKKKTGVVLNIDSNPQGAEVYIGDDQYKKTPITLTDFPIGKYIVKLKLEGYANYSEKIRTKSKKTTRINAQLNKKYAGFLDLKVFPENATITIDNNRRIYKNSYDLAPGKHKIKIDAPFYKKESKSLNIYNEENFSLDIKLVQKDPKKARRLAWMFPGIGHIYSDNNKKGLIWSVLGITGVLSTYVMYSEFSKYSNEYKTANQEYLGAALELEMAEKHILRTDLLNQKNSYALNLAVSGSITLGLWIWNIIDVNKEIPDGIEVSKKVDLGVNSKGQIEARFEF